MGFGHKVSIRQDGMKVSIAIDGLTLKAVQSIEFNTAVGEVPLIRVAFFANDVELDVDDANVDDEISLARREHC